MRLSQTNLPLTFLLTLLATPKTQNTRPATPPTRPTEPCSAPPKAARDRITERLASEKRKLQKILTTYLAKDLSKILNLWQSEHKLGGTLPSLTSVTPSLLFHNLGSLHTSSPMSKVILNRLFAGDGIK